MNSITGIIKRGYFMLACSLLLALTGCKNTADSKGGDEESSVKGKIEVTVTTPRIGSISQNETLNATTVYQLNDIVRAPIAGYIRKVNVTPGQIVKEGDILFTMQTKEAAAMGAMKDSLFPSKGAIVVKATQSGIVKTMTRQVGDYIQDGDELSTIANSSSLIFMLDAPFEMRRFIKMDRPYKITLPDGETISAQITSLASGMDKTVQMERYVLRSASPLNLPEGLIGSVTIPTTAQTNATILPKSAVLSNETQTQFWVMKLLNDSSAVKVDIEKGIETKDSVQVKSPVFTEKDRILITGNYGLADTVKVKIGGDKE